MDVIRKFLADVCAQAMVMIQNQNDEQAIMADADNVKVSATGVITGLWPYVFRLGRCSHQVHVAMEDDWNQLFNQNELFNKWSGMQMQLYELVEFMWKWPSFRKRKKKKK